MGQVGVGSGIWRYCLRGTLTEHPSPSQRRPGSRTTPLLLRNPTQLGAWNPPRSQGRIPILGRTRLHGLLIRWQHHNGTVIINEFKNVKYDYNIVLFPYPVTGSRDSLLKTHVIGVFTEVICKTQIVFSSISRYKGTVNQPLTLRWSRYVHCLFSNRS